MTTRKSKIARLPRAVREELNTRLRNGEAGKVLIRWLNEQEEVRERLRGEFGGPAVTEQNLSEWRKTGYAEWLARRDLHEHMGDLAADAALIREHGGAVSDHLACLVTARFARALADWDGTPDRAAMRELNALRALAETISDLRRGDHSAGKLEMERERVALIRLGVEKFLNEEVERRISSPEGQAKLASRDEKQQRVAERIRQIFGMSQPQRQAEERFTYAEGI